MESAVLLIRPHWRCAVAVALMGLAAACGSAEEAEVAPQPIREADAQGPLTELPPEELYGATPDNNIWSPQVELDVLDLPAGWDGARFAILSDFQIGLWKGNEQVALAAVQYAAASGADVILLLGDYLSTGTDTSPLQRILAPLQGSQAVAVLGDHDIRSDSIEAHVTNALETAGVRVLSNNSLPLERGGDTIRVGGLSPDILALGWEAQRRTVASTVAAGPTPILLTHLPALATRAPTGEIPIILGGGTFCGDVEVPRTPRLTWLRDEAFPNATIDETNRLFRVQGSTVFVSCGVGFGFLPVRFGAAPEVPILTLRRLAPGMPEIVEDTLTQQLQEDEGG